MSDDYQLNKHLKNLERTRKHIKHLICDMQRYENDDVMLRCLLHFGVEKWEGWDEAVKMADDYYKDEEGFSWYE